MINEMYKDMTGKGSVIREFFTYANKKAAVGTAEKPKKTEKPKPRGFG